MCFECKEKPWFGRERESKLRTAKRDIVCYKLLLKLPGGLRGIYVPAWYKVGELYHEPVDAFQYTDDPKCLRLKGTVSKPQCPYIGSLYCVIEIGYHSFRKRPHPRWVASYEITVECVIPKGTQYRMNALHYVSDAIQVRRILTNQ